MYIYKYIYSVHPKMIVSLDNGIMHDIYLLCMLLCIFQLSYFYKSETFLSIFYYKLFILCWNVANYQCFDCFRRIAKKLSHTYRCIHFCPNSPSPPPIQEATLEMEVGEKLWNSDPVAVFALLDLMLTSEAKRELELLQEGGINAFCVSYCIAFVFLPKCYIYPLLLFLWDTLRKKDI